MPNKTLRDIAIEIGINVNTLKSRIYRAEMAGRPRVKRDYESKRRSPLWKRNGDISDDLYRAGWDDGFNVCKGSNEAMDRILLRR